MSLHHHLKRHHRRTGNRAARRAVAQILVRRNSRACECRGRAPPSAGTPCSGVSHLRALWLRSGARGAHHRARSGVARSFLGQPARGRHFARMRVSDLLLVNGAGEIVVRQAAFNQAAFAIHAAIHEARPDIVAAAHTHSLYGKAWSTLGRKLDPLTQDSCSFYEDHALFDDFRASCSTRAKARALPMHSDRARP